MIKPYLYRLYPHKKQFDELSKMLNTARDIYNSALAERKYAYRSQRKSLNYYNQANELREIRKEIPEVAHLNYSVCQNTLRRLDRTYQSFFRRVKAGKKAGFPRFKGRDRFNSITFPAYGDGVKLKNGKLYIQNVGLVKIKIHRNFEGQIRTVTIKNNCDKWYASFSNMVEIKPLPTISAEVGIDMGIESFAVTSDSEFIRNPHYLKKSLAKLRIAQRRVSRRKLRSKNRRKATKLLAKQHLKIRNQRKDFSHKLSRIIVNRYGYIAVEDLQINNMAKNNHLAQSINDASWGQFLNFLSYKAEWAGRVFVKVNPNGTSQICSNCGMQVPKDLSVRIHRCPYCSIVLHRDYNSSLNVLALGRSVWDLTWNSGSCVSQEAVNVS